MSERIDPEDLLQKYFGPYALSAWQQLSPIAAATRRQEYAFLDMEVFNKLVAEEPQEAQAIYWREIIFRIHLTACCAIFRHHEWLRSLFLAIEHNCNFGAYASYRGFLESAANSFYTLSTVPGTISPHISAIVHRLRGKPTDTVYISSELEDRLIHFSHGRRLRSGENHDQIHAAKQIRVYLDSIKLHGAKDVHALYTELSSFTHPAAESVVSFLEIERSDREVIWRQRQQSSARKEILACLDRWRATNEIVFNAAFVPAFISLRMLHKINFLPKIPSLKSFPLNDFAAWVKIERKINH